MSIPQFVGAATPRQSAKIRLGRMSSDYHDNGNLGESAVITGSKPPKPHEMGTFLGAGHQTWDETNYPYLGRVGTKKSNPYYKHPWQARWFPAPEWIDLPNLFDVVLDKKLEGQVAGIGQATIQVENILYEEEAGVGGNYHRRKRGGLAPLRGFLAAANAFAPGITVYAAGWLEALEAEADGFDLNEWSEKFEFAAQIVLYQGYGEAQAKSFTGLIEDIDLTSRPDRVTITCRDFGQIFTDTHFFDRGKDPIINTPVIFVDSIEAAGHHDVGEKAKASSTRGTNHNPEKVLDGNDGTSWQSKLRPSAETTEWIEIELKEGVYRLADINVQFPGMDVYVSMQPAKIEGTKPPVQKPNSESGYEEMEQGKGNRLLDAGGWIDPSKEEAQKVPGGGPSYTFLLKDYPLGDQGTPIWRTEEAEEEGPVERQARAIRCGDGTILRLSFRSLSLRPKEKRPGGEGSEYRAGVNEFHGRREATDPEAEKGEWVITEDYADVVRTLCIWAGFKEWDIPQTGVRVQKRLHAGIDKAYIDVIKEACEGIGYIFFLADPAPDSFVRGEESLGIPTFRKSRVLSPDTDAERTKRLEGKEANGRITRGARGNSAALQRPGIPPPVVTDQSLLTEIQVKQSIAPLSGIIRIIGITHTQPGNTAAGASAGTWIQYTFIPPWGDRLAGIQKVYHHKDPKFATVELCRNAAWFAALQEALESAEATVEIPANPNLELDDHIVLLDVGTGVATRLHISQRSSHFTDGEQRKFSMTLTGYLIDTPNVRDMVNIINEVAEGEGRGGKLNPRNPDVVEIKLGGAGYG